MLAALGAMAFGMSENGADADEARPVRPPTSPLVTGSESAYRALRCGPELTPPVPSLADADAELVVSIDGGRRR
jgi:hypothetical protein